MARKKIHIDKDVLIKAVNTVESGKNPPANMTALYQAVSKMLNTTPGAVLGRIKDYGIPVKTPKGEKGAHLRKSPTNLHRLSATTIDEDWCNPSLLEPTEDEGAERENLDDEENPIVPEEEKPRQREPVKPAVQDETKVTLDVLPFLKRGIRVKSWADVMTSTRNSKADNENIRSAWREIRRKLDVPSPDA